MKRIIFLFVFLLVLIDVNAKLNSVEQQHTTESYNKRVALFEKLSSLLSSSIQNNNADFGAKVVSFRKLSGLASPLFQNNNTNFETKVVSFRKLSGLNFINQAHNSTSNGFIINVTFNASEEVCYSGTLNIVTSTDGLNVKVNNIYEGQTDYSYFIQKGITLANCQSSYSVDIYCYNNITLCYSETSYIPSNGETATVVESDCVKTCSKEANFWLTNKDAKISGNNINVTIHSSNINGNVDITMYRINEATGLVDDTKVLQTNIDAYSTSSVATNWDLSSASALNIYIDESGEFDENKDDNFVYRVIAHNIPKAYLSINTSYPEVDSLLRTYLEQYVEPVDEGQEDLIISVGRFTKEFKIANPETLKPSGLFWWKTQGWGYKDNRINAYGKTDSSSYAGIVGRTAYNGKPLILSYGNRLDGDIASVKKLISARQLMFSDLINAEKPPVIIDRYDTLALGINNLLRGFIDYSSPQFLSVVNKILFDNAYDVAIRTVKTLDTTSYGESTILRLKNVNSDYSDDFKDAISENDKPVVFSGGIFNDLEFWEEETGTIFKKPGLARELANEGKDTWEIEMNSGPTTDECSNCPNYNYSDMVDYYWPVLIAGVQSYSGKTNLDYVGYSQGCRVALNSLETFENGQNDVGYYFNYNNGQYELVDLKANPVDSFVGIGCSGTFRGYSSFKNYFGEYGDSILGEFSNQNHVSNFELGSRLKEKCYRILGFLPNECTIAADSLKSGENIRSISKNSAIYYLNALKDDPTKQPGKDISLDNLFIIYGSLEKEWKLPFDRRFQDGLATANDSIEIFNKVGLVTGNKELQPSYLIHSKLPKDNNVIKNIRRFLE